MTQIDQPLLRIQNLRTHFYTYGGVVKALNGVNLDVCGKEWLGLVGETGCGKSVTSLSVMRLIQPPGKIVEGQILLQGEDLLEKSDSEMREIRGSRIAMIFQDPTSFLNPVLKIRDQITETMIYHQIGKKDAQKRVIELVELVGISEVKKRLECYPHQLSGGMKQRIMIAMALSCNPEILIADEPTTNLDVTVQAQIMMLMKDLQKRFGSSILYITHNLGVVAHTCDRVAVMYAGDVVEIADTNTIFKKPSHPYTQGLMEAIPSPRARMELLKTIPGIVPQLIDPPAGCRFHPRCPKVMEICSKEKPRSVELGAGHTVMCHLYD